LPAEGADLNKMRLRMFSLKKYFGLFLIVVVSCTADEEEPQRIIDKAIEVAGGPIFENSVITFDFRNRHYITRREGGIFSHERVFTTDSVNIVHDYLTNEGFHREINDTLATVPDSMAVRYARSVNSTIYFALLPYGLNDAAVLKQFCGRTTFEGQSYYCVEITFEQEGGGEDYNDVFYYWIHDTKYTIDYMAYLYFSEGGGLRLRKAVNPRWIDGVLLQDYINFQPPHDTVRLEHMEALYKEGKLEELSRIELENITVTR
jgi:hypothetical protein